MGDVKTDLRDPALFYFLHLDKDGLPSVGGKLGLIHLG